MAMTIFTFAIPIMTCGVSLSIPLYLLHRRATNKDHENDSTDLIWSYSIVSSLIFGVFYGSYLQGQFIKNC